MVHLFDTGYGADPFRTLVRGYPDADTYPPRDFRAEWGPIFHRGRLDGTARVLAIGQDPGQHEAIARRILVGEAGQRVQGFLYKLGVDRSYVLLNAFLYSVYGQGGGERHKDDPAIVHYRNRWFDGVFDTSPVEVVVAFGGLARRAWEAWQATSRGATATVAFSSVPHPTWPESSSRGDAARRGQATRTMLSNWNEALAALRPRLSHPDAQRPFVPYGDAFRDGDLREIPEEDLPPGLPPWMRALETWADRTGGTAALKRVTITVTVPTRFRP